MRNVIEQLLGARDRSSPESDARSFEGFTFEEIVPPHDVQNFAALLSTDPSNFVLTRVVLFETEMTVVHLVTERFESGNPRVTVPIALLIDDSDIFESMIPVDEDMWIRDSEVPVSSSTEGETPN